VKTRLEGKDLNAVAVDADSSPRGDESYPMTHQSVVDSTGLQSTSTPSQPD
jgi:hypothetical protein